MNDNLTDRLLAALDLEQQIGESATPGEWRYVPDGRVMGGMGEHLRLGDRVPSWDGTHIAHQHPARTLRRVAALRRIVRRHTESRYGKAVCCAFCEVHYGYGWPCPDLLDFADALGVEP